MLSFLWLCSKLIKVMVCWLTPISPDSYQDVEDHHHNHHHRLHSVLFQQSLWSVNEQHGVLSIQCTLVTDTVYLVAIVLMGPWSDSTPSPLLPWVWYHRHVFNFRPSQGLSQSFLKRTWRAALGGDIEFSGFVKVYLIFTRLSACPDGGFYLFDLRLSARSSILYCAYTSIFTL